MVGTKAPSLKVFDGASHLRYRLVLSTLSASPVRITRIRADDSRAPGLSPSEVSFIRLLDKLSSGATIQINETGTTLTYRPGLLIGGDHLTHDCHPSRAIAYYVEPLLMLAPFCRSAMHVTLRGATHSQGDVCVDTLCNVTVPLLRRLTSGDGSSKVSLSPTLDVKRRSIISPPPSSSANRKKGQDSPHLHVKATGGTVVFRCDVVTDRLPRVDLVNNGVVKRVRGLAFGNHCSPGHLTRMIDTTRGIFNRFSPDVYIHTDHGNQQNCGTGYAMHLYAETTQGCLLAADWTCNRSHGHFGGGIANDGDGDGGNDGSDDISSPEHTARTTAAMLLDEIEHGGCVDTASVPLALLLAAVSEADLSRVRVGRLSNAAVALLRDIDTFLGVRFNMRVLGGSVPGGKGVGDDGEYDDDDESDDDDYARDGDRDVQNYGIVMSCVGAGITNTARQRF